MAILPKSPFSTLSSPSAAQANAKGQAGRHGNTAMSDTQQTPLPRLQILILMLVRLAEPIQYTVIFPFVNEMVEELHVTDQTDKIGYYSGLIEAVFALVQFFTVYHWATLSDKWGRQPVILIGLTGVAISGSLFGFSATFWQMIITRCLSGALNGNVAVVRAAIGDLTDDSNSTDAFAMYGLVWVIGSIFGNTIGGFLSHPVERLPHLFGGFALLKKYPFLLPCLCTTCITLCGLLFAWVALKEVGIDHGIGRHAANANCSYSHEMVLYNQAKSAGQRRPATGSYAPIADEEVPQTPTSDQDDDNDTLVGDNPESPRSIYSRDAFAKKNQSEATLAQSTPAEEEAMFGRTWGFWEIVALKRVQNMLASLFLISFVGGAWQAVSLLFFYTPTASGGIGMTPSAIGTALALQGAWSIICQLVFLGKLRRRWGVAKAYKILNSGFILLFALLPLLRTVVIHTEGLHAGEDGESRGVLTWMAVLGWLGLSTFFGLSNSFSMVLVNMASPDKGALGALNGLSTSLQCLARVLGPSTVSALFAVSIDRKILWGGQLWWVSMVLICTVSAVVGLLVREKEPAYQTAAAQSLNEVEEAECYELGHDKGSRESSDSKW